MDEQEFKPLQEQLEQERTLRKKAEAALVQEHFLLQALMNNMPDHIYFKDLESRIIRITKSQSLAFGLNDPIEAIGKTDFDFFTDEHARQAYQDEQYVIRTGQTLKKEEKETWPDKPDSWVSTTKLPLRDEKGTIVGTFGMSIDITERRRIEDEMNAQLIELTELNYKLIEAQNQLLQSEKLASVGQLAAGVAHEINNPIGFINSNLGSLKGQVEDLLGVLDAYERAIPALADSPDLLANIEMAKTNADLNFLREDIVDLINESLEGVNRVKTIVESLKDFARVDTTEWRLDNLEKGLESTLTIVWNEIKYKAEVIKEFAGLPEIECIASQMNQVFMNLLVNAAQAIEAHGTITVRTGFDEKSVWVEVEDTGKGIKPEHLHKIFEPFFTTKPVGQGTGLGLSLAYGIVNRHHGLMTVCSEVNKGTVFHITLPRVRVIDEAQS